MEIKKFVKKVAVFIGTTIFFVVLFRTEPQNRDLEKVYVLSEVEVFGEGLEWELVQTHFPIFKYLFHGGNKSNGYEVLVSNLSPLYRYLLSRETLARSREKRTDLAIGEEIERYLLEENAKDAFIEQEKEDKDVSEKSETEEKVEKLETIEKEIEKPEDGSTQKIDVASIFLTESDFVPNEEKKWEYDWENYTESEKIRETFFAVDATTEVENEIIQPINLLEKEIAVSEANGGPQILIYHTHSQESFADSIPEDENTSIVGAGEYLAEQLKEKYGYDVLHHTGEYDVETRDYAYSYALPNVEAILNEYPSIEVVIDLHRDAVADDRKLVSDQNGKQAAQVMFFNGLSYTKKQGKIDYLENPYIEDNLAFSFQMQVLCDEYYPGLTRRIYLKGYRYNMHLCPQSLLIELGAQTNTCEEVRNTLDILAHVLSMCLKKDADNL